MSAHRYQATWRGITFNRRYDNTGLVDSPAHLVAAYVESDYYLTALDMNHVSTQDYRELRQFLEGAEPNEAFEGLRIINGEGTIIASSVADLEDKTWALYEAFSIAACRAAFLSNDPPGVGPFNFRRATAAGAGYLDLRFLARPGTGRPIVVSRAKEGLGRPFTFQLIAFDPFAYSQTLKQITLGNLSDGNNTVTNDGNVYAKPQYVVTFSGSGPGAVILTNATTGQAFSMVLAGFAAADVLTLDVARATITLQTGAGRYDVRSAGFLSMMYLAPGANTIKWSAGSGITSVVVKYRDAYA